MPAHCPEIEIECDVCGEIDSFPLSHDGLDWHTRDVKLRLEKDGWLLPDGFEGQAICPECAADN